MKELSNQVMDHLGQGLVVLDKKGNFIYFNRKFLEMIEYTSEEMNTLNLYSLIENIESVDLEEKYKERMNGKKSSYEAFLISKKGKKIPVLVSGAPYYNENKEIIGVITLLTDISSSKKMEEKLKKTAEEAKKANEAKSRFLANLSHEIKNPLNAIIGIIELLRESSVSKENEDLLKTMRDSSYHILNMLDELLDLSKIEANKMKLDNIKFSMMKIYNSLYIAYKANSYNKKIDFKVDFDEKIPDLLIGDPLRLRQILDNILSNSFKFTKEGYVKMKFLIKEFKKDTVVMNIIIEDTGIGIEKKNLEKIFDAFSQEEVSISRKFGGTGLGLFIVKKLLDLMNGEIKIISEKNKGTKTYIKIPLKLVEDIDTKDLKDDKKIKILFVDDNEANLMTAKKVFHSYGYNCDHAFNGKEGINKIKSKKYDIIFIDSDMPIMNGIETINIIKSSKELADNSYVVFLSSQQQNIKEINVEDFLLKPLTKEKIGRIIENYKDFIKSDNLFSNDL